MKSFRRFIIIDDDPINNMICSMVINSSLEAADVVCFTNAIEGFNYIRDLENTVPTVLFLDINMPEINGWEFLEKFEALDDNKKSSLNIYLLSSSVNTEDKALAEVNQYVCGFISKPLRKETIPEIKSGS